MTDTLNRVARKTEILIYDYKIHKLKDSMQAYTEDENFLFFNFYVRQIRLYGEKLKSNVHMKRILQLKISRITSSIMLINGVWMNYFSMITIKIEFRR